MSKATPPILWPRGPRASRSSASALVLPALRATRRPARVGARGRAIPELRDLPTRSAYTVSIPICLHGLPTRSAYRSAVPCRRISHSSGLGHNVTARRSAGGALGPRSRPGSRVDRRSFPPEPPVFSTACTIGSRARVGPTTLHSDMPPVLIRWPAIVTFRRLLHVVVSQFAFCPPVFGVAEPGDAPCWLPQATRSEHRFANMRLYAIGFACRVASSGGHHKSHAMWNCVAVTARSCPNGNRVVPQRRESSTHQSRSPDILSNSARH